MKIRKLFAAVAIALVLPASVACTVGTTEAAQSSSSTTSETTDSGTDSDSTTDDAENGGGGPGGVDVASVSTEAELVALVQEAYGDGGLGLHRGHDPVQDVLDEVLTVSHDELHVRMDGGQNLAAVATDIGVDPQTLIDALVDSWDDAIDNVLATGEITEAEAEQYRGR